jgi:hypothetical protein
MRSRSVLWRSVCGALSILAIDTLTPLYAADEFEGLWAKTQKECLDEEGPNSRTLINLGNIIDGKPSPLFDQYENHCKIERRAVTPDGSTILSATCFEFWEDFTKGSDGQSASIKLLPGSKGTLKIDGVSYRRCEEKKVRPDASRTEASLPPLSLPDAEKRLILAVETARAAYASGANEMAQGAARPARAKSICAAIKSPQISGWIGQVETLSSNSDGLGVLAIRIADGLLIKTWNNSISDTTAKTLINPESSVFKKAVALKKGQIIRFSGQFIRDDTDCFREGSLSLKGSLTQPEFIFRFSDLVAIQ